MTSETRYQGIAKFHAHLDICSQCRNHTFSLCSVGAELLKEAATGKVDEPQDEGLHEDRQY